MATRNPFDLLDDDDNGDPSALLASLAAAKDKPAAVAAKKQQPAVSASGKMPSKPLPPAQAVKESRASPNEGGRGRGGGRGGRGFGNRESQEFGRGRGEVIMLNGTSTARTMPIRVLVVGSMTTILI